jgi:hypothetical protein
VLDPDRNPPLQAQISQEAYGCPHQLCQRFGDAEPKPPALFERLPKGATPSVASLGKFSGYRSRQSTTTLNVVCSNLLRDQE